LISIQPDRLGQLVLVMVALLLKNTARGELIFRNHPGKIRKHSIRTGFYK
jgi:hypothetical protein